MGGKGLLLTVALLLAPSPAVRAEGAKNAAAQEPAAVEVIAQADRSEVTIGTPFTYTLEIKANRKAEVIVPVLAGSLGDFSIVDFGREAEREEGSRTVSKRWYKLVAYTPGHYVIPGPTVQFREEGGELESVSARDVPVTVTSLLGKGRDLSSVDVRDIKQPVEVPFDWRPVGLVSAAAAVLVLLGYAAYRWANRKHFKAAAPPPPRPHQVALEQLSKLRRLRLLEDGKLEEYYVQLSGIVRTYLEGRFDLHAPEMTTEEFLQEVQRGRSLKPDHRGLLGDFLTESDMVKFARHRPAAEDAERAFAAAKRFVEESSPEG